MRKRKHPAIDHSDPLNCQTRPRLAYCEFFEDADRRVAKGEVSTLCATCQRWRWSDEWCERFVAADPQPQESDMLGSHAEARAAIEKAGGGGTP